MRRRPLVGRSAEVSALEAALSSDDAIAILRISGPVGIGKSALINGALQTCRERGVPARRLDPSLERVDGEVVRQALASLAGEAGPARRVLAIDDLHLARDAERWLAAHVDALAASTTVLLGDRQQFSLAWFGGAGITPIELPLYPLAPVDVTQLFDAYGVSATMRDLAAICGEGNPLLLTLFSDGEKKGAPAVEDALLRMATTLFPDYDDPARIAALGVLVTARASTGELIASAIGDDARARDAIRWLTSLSVIENTREGMMLHTAARLACATLLTTHHRTSLQGAVACVRKAEVPLGNADACFLKRASSDANDRASVASARDSGFAPRGGGGSSVVVPTYSSAAVALATEASTAMPQFSELLRSRLDELARQAALTEREREVFELLVLGRNANEMATALGITTRTVKFHQQRVVEKLGADSRLDILRLLL